MDFVNTLPPSILSISQLVRHMRVLLEQDEILQDVWVRGEVSNFKQYPSGHLYFTLKDSNAGIRCVMWKGQALRVRFEMRDGVAVEAHGSVNVYEVNGDVQLYVDSMRPAGEGELYQEFLRLKARLEAEGLFDQDHKRPIPELPKTIGLVTSSAGAALQDILNTLTRRYPPAKVVLAPTTVQGVEAPAGIVSSLDRLNRKVHPDVIIVARGGGSIEDLWGFNAESVARAIYASTAPVISGVGHETDFTIADFVADLRAPTPTGAAELATPVTLTDLESTLTSQADNLYAVMNNTISNAYHLLELSHDRLKRLSPIGRINIQVQRLDELGSRFLRAMQTGLKGQRSKIESLNDHLDSLDPVGILKRGYAIVTREIDSSIVTHVSQVNVEETLIIRVQDGSIKVLTKEKKQEEQNA